MTQTVQNAVAQRESGPVTIMWRKRSHYDAVLPDHIDVEAFLGLAAGALYRDEKLMEAATRSPDSLMNALMRCATLGHQPGTEEFYLIPRKNKGKPEVQGIEGYRGIVERMYRSGAVASVKVREVCANDPFRFVEGDDEIPVHRIGGEGTTGADFFGPDGSRDRGAMVGVYAYARLTTGAWSRVVLLSRDDVMTYKARSEGADSEYSPWKRDERAMWWKTAARRLEPWVPTSAEYRREQLRAAVEADNLRRPPADPTTGEIRDTEVHHGEVVSDDDQTALDPAGDPPTDPAETT